MEAGAPEDLVGAAVEQAGRAYAPYSRFRVGAAVRTSDGRVYGGCNVENSSYGLTVCAERTAVFKAVSEGSRGVVEVAVYAADSDEPVPPCGACLQVLSEFARGDPRVYMISRTGRIRVARLSQLLPMAFRLGGETG
ncbi:cytidine deaminase [Aeropyrum pernix K1]|uniref:cytidine deaminase n=1 Tax=Aeropyrum pernix (strain ATCC 700893 / DSM 11879 / JCM 9820 / NBRC 100138 / K1) TaxID=272557 RepID=Q9YD74_AERPE|nr:cytidine deaminase [Aeropyrum pernix]BAA80023.2 cytidine deaminase [Aeropyrum pernix K1]